MRFFALSFAVLSLAVAGCGDKAKQEDPPESGFHLDVGGVSVDAEPGKGVDVSAPNTDVHVGGGQGVQVEAPGANVNIQGAQDEKQQ